MPFRVSLIVALTSLLPLAMPAHAAVKPQDAIESPAMLAQMQSEADGARPREQIFLYTQLVHVLSEIAGRELADGETEKAAAMLAQVQHYADLIHLGLTRDTKRLRDAEMLMHTTTHHLGEYLHLVSSEDKVTLQATLTRLNQVNDELLSQVFQH
jgi:hypothetical protein